ncbi:MAG: hypothetical protein H0T62_12470 [Parachlamydiaceae bacterium]|nr:hypothetical protein [Parachlamydiaceae bacterium]
MEENSFWLLKGYLNPSRIREVVQLEWWNCIETVLKPLSESSKAVLKLLFKAPCYKRARKKIELLGRQRSAIDYLKKSQNQIFYTRQSLHMLYL